MSISLILSLAIIAAIFWLAVQNPDITILKGLYKPLPIGDVINWPLVIILLILFWILFLLLVILFGNRKELLGQIPSWGEIIIPAFLSIVFQVLISNINIQGQQSGQDQNIGNALSNFSPNMKWILFGGNLLGIFLITYYFTATETKK